MDWYRLLFFGVLWAVLMLEGRKRIMASYEGWPAFLDAQSRIQQDYQEKFIGEFLAEDKRTSFHSSERGQLYWRKQQLLKQYTQEVRQWLSVAGTRDLTGASGDSLFYLVDRYQDHFRKNVIEASDSSWSYADQGFPLAYFRYSGAPFNQYQGFGKRYFKGTTIDARRAIVAAAMLDLSQQEIVYNYLLHDMYGFRGGGWDAIAAIAVPIESYSPLGEPVTARILIAHYNKSAKFNITSEVPARIIVQNGVGTLRFSPNQTPGPHLVRGTISTVHKDTVRKLPWSIQYFVGLPGAPLNLDNQQILYSGVDNPVSVDPAGYPADKLFLQVRGAKVFRKDNTHFQVRTGVQPGQTVEVKMRYRYNEWYEPTLVSIGHWKVKALPEPAASIDGVTGSSIPAEILASVKMLSLRNQVEGFDGAYRLLGYTVRVEAAHGDADPIPINIIAADLSPEARSALAAAKEDDHIVFDNIRVKGPAGAVVFLPPYVLRVVAE